MISRRTLLIGAGLGALATGMPLSACSSSASDGRLSVYSWRQEDTEGYTQLFDQFTAENAGIEVTFEPYNSTDYDQILSTALKSGDNLDVIQLRPYAPGVEIIETGDLEPLDDLPGLADFDPAYLDAVRGTDGAVYGVPLALNALITLYNAELFEKHSVDVPTTWPEFLAACEKLKAAGLVPIAQSGKAAYLLSILFQAVSAAAISDEFMAAVPTGDADFTSAEFRAAVQRVLDLQPYLPESFIGMADDEARAMFAQGEAAMYINGDYRIKPILDLNPDLDLAYLPSLPDSGDGARLCNFVDGAYSIHTNSDRLDDSRTLLAWMASADFGNAFAATFARLSPVPGAKAEDELHVQLAQDVEERGVANLTMLISGGEPSPKSEFENALQGVLGGQIQLDDLLTTTQAAYQNMHS